jgi:DMSO/TMAO reductase YedYZ molybdopterin-dependent catalytic subunit
MAIDKKALKYAHGTKISRRTILKAGAAMAMGLAGISAAGCTSSSPAPGEMKEYNGQQLTPASGFRNEGINGTQNIGSGSYSLTMSGLVDQQKTYSYADLLKMTGVQRVVKLNCVEGWDATALWEGVSLAGLLDDAGVMPSARNVIFKAQDGDSTSFAVDDARSNNFMIAYKINGIPLTADRGYPTRLVADNKWGYKWIKWITGIELSDKDYTGYWESNGYSNVGDLSQSFLS